MGDIRIPQLHDVQLEGVDGEQLRPQPLSDGRSSASRGFGPTTHRAGTGGPGAQI